MGMMAEEKAFDLEKALEFVDCIPVKSWKQTIGHSFFETTLEKLGIYVAIYYDFKRYIIPDKEVKTGLDIKYGSFLGKRKHFNKIGSLFIYASEDLASKEGKEIEKRVIKINREIMQDSYIKKIDNYIKDNKNKK